MTSARPKRVPGQQRVIVHAMLMRGCVGRPEDLMASVSFAAKDAVESSSFPTFHHDRIHNLFNPSSFGTLYAALRNSMEASMRKMFLAVTSAAALGGMAMTAANAMPVASALPTASNVDQASLGL